MKKIVSALKYFIVLVITCLLGLYIYNMVYVKSFLESKPLNNNSVNTEETGNESENDKTVMKEIKYENGAYYIDGVLIVNKTYALDRWYKSPSASENTQYCRNCLSEETLNAFKQMQTAASVLGLNLVLSSGYRSYSFQENLYNNYVKLNGLEAADTFSARPGHSEHQTGLAFDLNQVNDSFISTDEGKWVNNQAYLYGFIIRYPKGKENITGYKYEPWHLRYVGKDLAEKLYNNGNWITLEEYFNITSSYDLAV